jgi:hypothetical protein
MNGLVAGQRLSREGGDRFEVMVECIWDAWTSNGQWMSKKMRQNTVETVRHVVAKTYRDGIDNSQWYADALGCLVVYPNLVADDSDG